MEPPPGAEVLRLDESLLAPAVPLSDSDEEDPRPRCLPCLPATLDAARVFGTYDDLGASGGSGLLCEECEVREAACRCDDCAETLCSARRRLAAGEGKRRR